MEEVEVEDEDSSSSMTQTVPPRGKAAAPVQTRSHAAVACPAVPPSQRAEACPAAAPAVPAVACPAADPEPGRRCPHTPPGYERVRDSEKCAARLQRRPARDTTSTETAAAPEAPEPEGATNAKSVPTTPPPAAQWLAPAADDSRETALATTESVGDSAEEPNDEASAVDREPPEPIASSQQKAEEKKEELKVDKLEDIKAEVKEEPMEDVAEPTGSASASSAAACATPPVHPTGSRRKSRRRKSPVVHRGVLAPAVPDALMISKEEVELEDAKTTKSRYLHFRHLMNL